MLMKDVQRFALAAMLLSLAAILFQPVKADPLDSLETFDFEELSITSVATGFTTSKIAPANAPSAKAAMCTVETNPAKHREDGTVPTTSVGQVWPVTTVEPYVINGINDVRRFRAIATTGTTKLECSYLR